MENSGFGNFECPECFNEGAYFNGSYYECPNCGREWDDHKVHKHGDQYQNDDSDFDNSEMLTKFIEKQDEIRVGKRIDKDAFRNLFSPSWQFEKRQMECSLEGTIEESFANEIMSELIKTKNYSAIQKIKTPKGLTEFRKTELIEGQVYDYLDSVDELPFSPSVKEWAHFINAPEELIEKIMAKYSSHIITFLPKIDEGELMPLFNKKIGELYKILKKRREFEEYGKFTLHDLKNCFQMIANGERGGEDDNPFLDDEVRRFFSKEFQCIKAYRNDLNNFRNGTFDNMIMAAKNQGLSKIDTLVFILEPYFKDIME